MSPLPGPPLLHIEWAPGDQLLVIPALQAQLAEFVPRRPSMQAEQRHGGRLVAPGPGQGPASQRPLQRADRPRVQVAIVLAEGVEVGGQPGLGLVAPGAAAGLTGDFPSYAWPRAPSPQA